MQSIFRFLNTVFFKIKRSLALANFLVAAQGSSCCVAPPRDLALLVAFHEYDERKPAREHEANPGLTAHKALMAPLGPPCCATDLSLLSKFRDYPVGRMKPPGVGEKPHARRSYLKKPKLVADKYLPCSLWPAAPAIGDLIMISS